MPLLHPFTQADAVLALSIFFATFAYEDGATLLAATLSTSGRLDARLGLLSAFLGIWIGDVGLYAVGAGLGGRIAQAGWLGRLVSREKLTRAENWFTQRGPLALVMSRFIPGSRLPLYLGAGALRFPSRLFVAITGICSAIWVSVVFVAWQFVPHARLSSDRWLWFASAPLAPWLLSKTITRVVRRVRTLARRCRRWEFWPAWLFYPPVAAMCVWLSLRYRGFSLPTIANPGFRNGGIVGESKIDMLNSLMKVASDFTADAYAIPEGDLSTRLRTLETLIRERSISYPFVLKPNVGQRGAGFKLTRTSADAEEYLAHVQSDVVLQRYIDGPKEIGVFYYRFPDTRQGEIFAITEKAFPTVVGDGVKTLEDLVYADCRARLIAATYLDRFSDLRRKVLPEGLTMRLVEAGNHCQGCIFRDGSHLLTEALRERIDEISQCIPGFFIGRYDIRYASDEDLQRGENFRIIELNGAASEATNIYDERNSLLSAYRTLYRQWELVYAIGRANRDLGHEPASPLGVWKDWHSYRTLSASYPSAD